MSSRNIYIDEIDEVDKSKNKENDIKQLHEQNKDFENMFSNMLYGFAMHKMIFDEAGQPSDFIFLDINNSFKDITGLGNEILGKRVLEVLPDIEKKWIDKLGYTVKTREVQKFEEYLQQLDKIFSVTVFSPKEGYFATIIEDVTEYKKSENSYKEIFNNSPVGLFKMTYEGKLISYNNSFSKIFGYHSYEEMSKYITNFYDLLSRKNEINEILNLALKKKDIKNRIIKVINKETDFAVCKINMIYVKEDITGKKMIEGTIIDITQEKIKENVLRISDRGLKMIVDAADIANFDFNYEVNSYNYSGYLLKYLGYTGDVITYKDDYIYSLIHYEDELEFRKRMSEVYNKKDKDVMEYRMKSTKGKYYWVRITVQSIKRDFSGRSLRILGAIKLLHEDVNKQGRIKYFSEHDILTDLHNRNHFNNTLINTTINQPTGVILYDFDGLKLVNDSFGYEAGDKALRIFSNTLKKVYHENSKIFRIGGDEFAVVIQNKDRKYIEEKMDIVKNEIFKFDSMHKGLSVSGGYSYCEGSEFMERLIREAEEAMFRRKLLKGKSIRSEMIKSLKASLNEKTHETEQHCSRIERIAVEIGIKLNLDSKALDDLRLMSVLHDIGKIGIPNTILNKPDKLTNDEWKIMKQHSEIGYRIAVNMRDLSSIAKGILYHHERWDGNGYPEGLEKEKIPLISRIISVSDAYDAMTNDRSYRKAMNIEKALNEIETNSGTQFDPIVVEAFKCLV